MTDIDTGSYLVERYSAGSWGADGKFSRGAKTELQIEASIQPLSGNMIKLLPEHRRNSESIHIFSEERLYPSDEKSQNPSDVVTYDDKKFEIFTVKKWADVTDIPHYESIGIMQDGQGA